MDIRQTLISGGCDAALATLYGAAVVDEARARCVALADTFEGTFGTLDGAQLFSAPGRTELSGNHTDHNHGRVLAAAVDMDILAVAAPRTDKVVRVHSEGFAPLELTVDALAPRADEEGTSAALIRGVAEALVQRGGTVGGFDAVITSRVPQGSGLSSSAAYEILIGTIINTMYCANRFSPVELAIAAQYAENVHFGKPSGLMDQMACSVGGAVAIDFADPTKPLIRSIAVDFADFDRVLCIVDTGGSHADLTPDYAAVPEEMKTVAKHMGVGFLRETDAASVLARACALREACGDRALLRAFHFFAEDQRAENMAKALEQSDISAYEALMRESGRSSFQFLQNLYSTKDVSCQGLSLAICVAEQILGGEGAARVHGGGFAGTIQALVPTARLDAFREAMESVFGSGRCHVLRLRPVGGVCIDAMT